MKKLFYKVLGYIRALKFLEKLPKSEYNPDAICEGFKEIPMFGTKILGKRLRKGFRDIGILIVDLEELNKRQNDKRIRSFFGKGFELGWYIGNASCIASTNGNVNLINKNRIQFVICDKTLWERLSEEERKFFILHELGHILTGQFDGITDMRGVLLDQNFEAQADRFALAEGAEKPDIDSVVSAMVENPFTLKSMYRSFPMIFNVQKEVLILKLKEGMKLLFEERMTHWD